MTIFLSILVGIVALWSIYLLREFLALVIFAGVWGYLLFLLGSAILGAIR